MTTSTPSGTSRTRYTPSGTGGFAAPARWTASGRLPAALSSSCSCSTVSAITSSRDLAEVAVAHVPRHRLVELVLDAASGLLEPRSDLALCHRFRQRLEHLVAGVVGAHAAGRQRAMLEGSAFGRRVRAVEVAVPVDDITGRERGGGRLAAQVAVGVPVGRGRVVPATGVLVPVAVEEPLLAEVVEVVEAAEVVELAAETDDVLGAVHRAQRLGAVGEALGAACTAGGRSAGAQGGGG